MNELVIHREPEPPRCEACESVLIRVVAPSPEYEHPDPAFRCENPCCPSGGVCLTCARLVEWYRKQDEADEP